MMVFLVNNGGTLFVGAILIIIVGLVIIKMRRDRKKGKSSCGCGCQSCPSTGICHKKQLRN